MGVRNCTNRIIAHGVGPQSIVARIGKRTRLDLLRTESYFFATTVFEISVAVAQSVDAISAGRHALNRKVAALICACNAIEG